MTSLKYQAIDECISSINFKSENWSVEQIQEALAPVLGERPGVEVVYKKDVKLNENTGKTEEIHAIEKIEIIFFDLDDKFKKASFLIDT